MTRKPEAFDFKPSPVERRRKLKKQRLEERKRKKLKAAELKRSKKDALRRMRELRQTEIKRKREEKRQHQMEERRQRAERKRWQKSNRQPQRWGSARGERDLRTATRLFDWFGSILGRQDKAKQAELIAYADEHMHEIYEAPVQPDPAESQSSGQSWISRAASGIRRLVGGSLDEERAPDRLPDANDRQASLKG